MPLAWRRQGNDKTGKLFPTQRQVRRGRQIRWGRQVRRGRQVRHVRLVRHVRQVKVDLPRFLTLWGRA